MRTHPRGLPVAGPAEAPATTDPAPVPGLLGLFTQALLGPAGTSREPVNGAPAGLEAMIRQDLVSPQAECDPEPAAASATPHWGGAPASSFQAVAVEVAGVRLVAPLAEVDGVVDFPRRLSRMPGIDPWILGVFHHRERSVRVVDSARLLGIATEGRELPWRRVVLFGAWGLAFDGEDSVLDVAPRDLRWRAARPLNPWMAGTVVSLMSPLVDVGELFRWLEGGHSGGNGTVSASPRMAVPWTTAF